MIDDVSVRGDSKAGTNDEMRTGIAAMFSYDDFVTKVAGTTLINQREIKRHVYSHTVHVYHIYDMKYYIDKLKYCKILKHSVTALLSTYNEA